MEPITLKCPKCGNTGDSARIQWMEHVSFARNIMGWFIDDEGKPALAVSSDMDEFLDSVPDTERLLCRDCGTDFPIPAEWTGGTDFGIDDPTPIGEPTP